METLVSTGLALHLLNRYPGIKDAGKSPAVRMSLWGLCRPDKVLGLNTELGRWHIFIKCCTWHGNGSF